MKNNSIQFKPIGDNIIELCNNCKFSAKLKSKESKIKNNRKDKKTDLSCNFN
jgi:hypothetical protein